MQLQYLDRNCIMCEGRECRLNPKKTGNNVQSFQKETIYVSLFVRFGPSWALTHGPSNCQSISNHKSHSPNSEVRKHRSNFSRAFSWLHRSPLPRYTTKPLWPARSPPPPPPSRLTLSVFNKVKAALRSHCRRRR